MLHSSSLDVFMQQSKYVSNFLIFKVCKVRHVFRWLITNEVYIYEIISKPWNSKKILLIYWRRLSWKTSQVTENITQVETRFYTYLFYKYSVLTKSDIHTKYQSDPYLRVGIWIAYIGSPKNYSRRISLSSLIESLQPSDDSQIYPNYNLMLS